MEADEGICLNYYQNAGIKAIKFEESIIINSLPEQVFDFTQDYSVRLRGKKITVSKTLKEFEDALGEP